MRPLMLLLLSLPLLVGTLALVTAPTSARELLLPPRPQWTWAQKLRAAGFASDCSLGGASALAATDVLPDGGLRITCHRLGAHHLPEVG